MATWPATLPQKPRVESLRVWYSRAVASFQPDIGRPIRRKRQTDRFKNWSGVYVMNDTQQDAFWTFYNTTINDGLDSFTMTDPQADTSVTVEFLDEDPPVFEMMQKNSSEGWYNVELRLRVVS